MDGAEVQRQNALSVAIGSFASTLLTIPAGKCVEGCHAMVIVTIASLAFATLYGAIALQPSELFVRLFWGSRFARPTRPTPFGRTPWSQPCATVGNRGSS